MGLYVLRRKSFLSAIFSLLILSHGAIAADVAITMDDFRFVDSPIMTGKEQDERILNTIKKNKIEIIRDEIDLVQIDREETVLRCIKAGEQ